MKSREYKYLKNKYSKLKFDFTKWGIYITDKHKSIVEKIYENYINQLK